MRLSKYLTLIAIITCISLFYTHQQFLIVKANYDIKNCEIKVSQLLDQQKKLMYTVDILESPKILEKKLKGKGIKYTIPRSWAVVKEERIDAGTYYKVAEKRNTALERFFNFLTKRVEAQALEDRTVSYR